jgi:hypothetical protein
MPKTQPPGEVTIPGIGTFLTDAVPDPFDERDLEYRPRLQPLPVELDQRAGSAERYVMTQEGQSCTGHALAAVINCVLARNSDGGSFTNSYPRVSPYMLYHLARRYDEFEGETDLGSSLRGALKGWFHHGVVLEDDWSSLDTATREHLDDDEILLKAREYPLGAFYRVNAYRLDDMQSAIGELNAVAASAQIHDGWENPVPMENDDGTTMHVIRRSTRSRPLGGHAFALVGYNTAGFLVQNSWGTDWGAGGFATLPYEEWLDSAYDAWVARPGVPKTPFATGRTRTATATHGELATARGPDLKRLSNHVVNLGNEGRLSGNGRFVSTVSQVHGIFENMNRAHTGWLERGSIDKRHVVLYAHGGLVNEAGGLQTADKHLNWWLNNRIYPIYFAWQSGPEESLINQLVDALRNRLPFGGLGFDLVEQFDALCEKLARASFRWMWDEMKENARAASQGIANRDDVQWPPQSSRALAAMHSSPGGSLTVLRLAEYMRVHKPENVVVHLVGHSAGAIFQAALLQRMLEENIAVDSMALLAPAIRIDEFDRDILPHIGESEGVKRFVTFGLSDERELDDVCGHAGVNVYHKSLLYLVSRALERASERSVEVPLLGMDKWLSHDREGKSTSEEIANRGGVCIASPSRGAVESRSDSTSHGGFDDDSPTMTSVLIRMLALPTLNPESVYEPHSPSPQIETDHISSPVEDVLLASGWKLAQRASRERQSL